MWDVFWNFPIFIYHLIFTLLFWVVLFTGLYAVVTFYWDKYKHKLSFPKRKKRNNDDIDWENGI